MVDNRWIRATVRAPTYAFAIAAAAVVIGAGAYGIVSNRNEANGSNPPGPAGQPIRDVYDRLEQFARAPEPAHPAASSNSGQMLPDVDTMIQRLAKRLETTPDDAGGWQMLGWSYFQVARYEQSAAAYARAMTIEPGSAELRARYQEAKGMTSR